MNSQHEAEQVLLPTAVRQPHKERRPVVHAERIALVDLLDRVLAGGVVVSGEVTLSIADVDMVRISLRALVTSISTLAGVSDDPEVPGR